MSPSPYRDFLQNRFVSFLDMVHISDVFIFWFIQRSLDLHPSETFYSLDASSPKTLIYTQEDFRHRIIVLSEADSFRMRVLPLLS